MNSNRRPETKRKVRLALRARKFARENAVVVSVLAIVVAIGVTALFMRRVLAAKNQIRVLDCPVAHAVAHHHDDSCYDDQGNLVCTLPERDLHVHDEGCFERKLACGLKEGEGVHTHDESCYDAHGNLICDQEEGRGHVHTDDCYAEVLTCGKDEVTEEHVHGDGCFRMVAANEDALEMTHPGTTLSHEVYNKDKHLEMRVDVTAPMGALPEGATMDAELLDPDKVDIELVQKTLDEHADEIAGDNCGQLLKWQAVRITFNDAAGKEIEPSEDVAVKLTTDLAKTADARTVVRMDNPEGEKRVLKRGERKPRKGGEATEQVMEQLTGEQLEASKIKLDDNQVAFETCESNCYVLATTSLRHEMDATDGSTVTIDVTAPAEAGIPADAYLDVKRVEAGTDAYDEYVGRTVEAMSAKQSDVALAQFFDIHIVDGDGNEIQPATPVDVKIELADVPEAPNGFAAVHFKQTGEGDDAATELEQLECGGENGTVTFAAESFSVYGIVYTVDFGYEVDGQLYEYTLDGGGAVSLRELAEQLHIYEGDPKHYESADAFIGEIADVNFSTPQYLWVQRVYGATTLQQILEDFDLNPYYSAETTDEQKALLAQNNFENDWVLVSLEPFTTTEMLTITMSDGTERYIAVTDAQDDELGEGGGALRAAGDAVETIPNPAGTTIDLFDYWVDGSNTYKYAGNTNNDAPGSTWPGWGQDRWYIWGNDGHPDDAQQDDNGRWYIQTNNGRFYQTDNGQQHIAWGVRLGGSGYNAGINEGHRLKFNPSNGGTVPDGGLNEYHSLSQDNTNGRTSINSWTGDADPTQGLVVPTLVNGYPQLSENSTLGSYPESLAYLFNANDSSTSGTDRVNGKDAYLGVDRLMYVDENGYYVFDSNDCSARYDASTNSFTVKEHTSDATGTARGFWPFGDRVFWHGMHVNSSFSMPGTHIDEDGNEMKGMVLNPKGQYLPMSFEFMGDDDTWIYIDGVLVGDGGGIHNRTYITIDFSTGSVVVSGTRDSEHQGGDEYRTTLREILMPADNPGKYGFTAADFDGNTFAPGSSHTFDMFYLERGGGESNLKLKYNLVSTGDFTAHKAYYGESGQPLTRDQYKFVLTGLKGEYAYSDATGLGTLIDANSEAIMPEGHFHAQQGNNYIDATVANPIYNPSEQVILHDAQGNELQPPAAAQAYATGVSEDGNVNFGTADTTDLRQSWDPTRTDWPAYRYIVREEVPDDAVNPYGVRWADATDAERKADHFEYDNTLYSGEIYYFVGYLAKESGNFVWKKKYYTDDTYTTRLTTESDPSFGGFADFKNRYSEPPTNLKLTLHKVDDSNPAHALNGAKFRLSRARFDTTSSAWVVHETQPQGFPVEGTTAGTTVGDGTLTFDNLTANYYLLEETEAPSGFELPDNKWLVEVKREDWVEVAGGAQKPLSELEDSETPVRVFSKLAPSRILELRQDGTVVSETSLPYDYDPNANPLSFSHTIENHPFRFDVEKKWENIAADHAALRDAQNPSEIVVTIGRYTVEDIAGTLNIVKKGMPAGATQMVSYLIEDSTGQQQPLYSNMQWDGSDFTFGPYKLAPGTYTVTEQVAGEDGAYEITHGENNPQTIEIKDGVTSSLEFTTTYHRKTGSIRIHADLVNNSSQQAGNLTNGVRYKVYDSEGNLCGNTNGYTYDEAHGTVTVSNLPTGTYTIEETGWADPSNTRHTNTCADEDGNVVPIGDNHRITVEVEAGAAKTYNFTAAYERDNYVKVVVYKYDYIVNDPDNCTLLYTDDDNGNTVDASPRVFLLDNFSGDTVQLDFSIGTGSYGSDGRVGDEFFSKVFNDTLSHSMIDNWKDHWQGSIPKDALGDDNTLYVGNRWGLTSQFGSNGDLYVSDGTHTWNLKNEPYTTLSESSINQSKSRAAANDDQSLQGASRGAATQTSTGAQKRSEANGVQPKSTKGTAGGLRAVAPIVADKDNDGVVPDSYGEPKHPEGKRLQDDASFSHNVTLTYADDHLASTDPHAADTWRETVEGLPATDENGNRYCYYIKAVVENNMPKNTNCSVVTDDETVEEGGEQVEKHYQVMASRKDDITETGGTLAVSNNIGKPTDVDVLKVDSVDETTPLGGAVFRLERQIMQKTTDPETQLEVETPAWELVTNYTVVKRGTDTGVAVDSTTGEFTVPATGVTIKALDPGKNTQTYRLVEVTPPPGYIMSKTDYEFTVNRDGEIVDDHDYIDDDLITIPNTPGEELPHSGGPGTIVSTVAGVLLATFGAITLLRNRRRAAEAGERR